jgi:hypothetical protein
MGGEVREGVTTHQGDPFFSIDQGELGLGNHNAGEASVDSCHPGDEDTPEAVKAATVRGNPGAGAGRGLPVAGVVLGWSPVNRAAFPLLLATALTGCRGVVSYGVATGPVAQPRAGSVAIFATRAPEVGRELGIVEARGGLGEASVDVLFPELVRRVQELGGNALVLDQTDARFELVTTWSSYQQLIPCGSRGFCLSWVAMPTTHEAMTVVLRGRAWALPEGEP